MNIELIREYCLRKRFVTEELPFNEDSPVYKVMGKIFLIASLDQPISINLKCDPEKAVDLREKYDCVKPGYHMNKMHWNTVEIDNSVSDKLIYEWIDHSFNLVVKGLKKKDREKILSLKD
jgi:predicted DNA-binding protein (MmcQ/YjbR family)